MQKRFGMIALTLALLLTEVAQAATPGLPLSGELSNTSQQYPLLIGADSDTTIVSDSDDDGPAGGYEKGDFALLDLAVARVSVPSTEMRPTQPATLTWQTETVDDAGEVGKYTSLALDSAGRPHISYFDETNIALRYAYYDGSGWIVESVDDPIAATGQPTSLALDSADRPHIAYPGSTQIKYAHYNGSTWEVEPVSNCMGYGCLHVSLALDSAGQPHLSYHSVYSPKLHYAYFNGQTWEREMVDGRTPVGSYTSLALDSGGNPHIAYFDAGAKDLRYAHHDGSTWISETVDSAWDVGQHASLALDSNDRPHISYYAEYDSYGGLRYAHYDGSEWISETLMTGGLGMHSSLALDADDLPHISYYWDTADELVYAYHDGTSWMRLETIDSDGNVGQYTSIALDSHDYVHISYYDVTHTNLKHAIGGEGPIHVTHIVNTTDDTDDGACNVAHCSLREAIDAANGNHSSEIQFDIPTGDGGFDGTVWTIQPTSPLPAVTQKLNLYGATQAANQGDTNTLGPEIVLNGSLAGTGANGLALAGPGLVDGLSIVNWDQAGVYVAGGADVTGCYIGANRTGQAAAPNRDGIICTGGYVRHIGGTETGEGNLISGNSRYGVHLSGAANVQVQGNTIGANRDGTAGLSNGDYGVYLSDDAQWNILGSDQASGGNLISGNLDDGVYVEGSGPGYNKLWGNRIGVNAAATGVLANWGDGVTIRGSDWNTIGGVEANRGNVIGGSILHGIHLYSADHTIVAGNSIGTGSGGSGDLGNAYCGVNVSDGSQSNTVGPDNVIAHNGGGVCVNGSTTIHNTITQNSITDNDDKGISLSNYGNEELLSPIISQATTDHVQGTACPFCLVEIFSDPDGEGGEYEAQVPTSVYGTWIWNGSLSLDPAFATATATDGDGNTSEFGICRDEHEPNEDFAHAIQLETGTDVESFICNSDDEDYYRFSVVADSVITITLTAPQRYTLSLYDSDETLLEETVSPHGGGTATIGYTSSDGGIYFVRVIGSNLIYDADDAYTLHVTAVTLPTHVDAWIDEGWIGDAQVYKLIPDADGPADRTYVEVVVDVTAESDDQPQAWIFVNIPGDVFGPPVSVEYRYCIGCGSIPVNNWYDEGEGRYLSAMLLVSVHRPDPHGQMIFRFEIPPGISPSVVIPSVEVRYTRTGEIAATATAPAIVLVNYVPAIIVTSRRHLYETDYNRADSAELLGQVTQAAQGWGAGPAGSMLAAIYYADDYSTQARDWDNLGFDVTSESTANVAADDIDRLVEDWIEDAGGGEGYLLILGDDDVIPFGRRTDICTGDDSEAAHGGDSDTALNRVVTNDFYLTDNWYADTDHADATEGELELNVGRIVGDTAADMQSLFLNSLSGPNYGSSPRAVLASWDHNDLDLPAASYASVLEHVRDWGFSASDDLVDNEDWRRDDLLDALRTQFGLMISANHGNPYDIAAPPDKVSVGGSAITNAISANTPLRQPFYGFGDCRVGFTLVEGGLVDRLIHQEASGFVAAAGISWGLSAGFENYTEEVYNNFWRRALNDSSTERPVGEVLRSAKADYSAGARWSCRDQKGVMQLNLYSVPWMALPAIGSMASASNPQAVRQETAFSIPEAVRRGTPQATLGEAYAITTAVDGSVYSVTQPISGFDLVEVDGFRQRPVEGPLLPSQDLSFPLPPGAEIADVNVQLGQEVSLGTLNIPIYIPGVALYPDGRDPEWVETPAETGIVPTKAYTYEVKNLGSHQVAHVHLIPLVYDAASDQTTLYRQITVTVGYTTPVAVAITDFYPSTRHQAPGTAVSAHAEVVNVSDAPVSVTTTVSLSDVYGAEVGRATGGPYTIPAGSSTSIAPTAPAASAEGAYEVRLTLWHDGVAVAQVSDVAQVVAAQIVGLEGPESVRPGETAVFSATLANYTASSLATGFALELTADWGQSIATLTSPTQTVPAGGQATATFAWDSADAPLGRYHATAVVSPTGYSSRSLTQLFHVYRSIYLPLVLRE